MDNIEQEDQSIRFDTCQHVINFVGISCDDGVYMTVLMHEKFQG